MSVDKKIDYVEQDGYNNYIKNSDSVTVPRKFKSRKNATPTKLAYITDAEAKQLKKQNKGTPHKGPSGIPSYDSFDAQGGYTSGTAMSAAETGSSNARDRAEVRASNIGAPKGAGPGVKSQQEQDLRSAAINAGAGQRVNPGFFDSRNTISPVELAMAKAYRQDPTNTFARGAYKNTRGGGLGSFISGGGLLGNLIRGAGRKFGLGKNYNEPTYDMSGINTRVYENIPSVSTNPDYYNNLGNELMLSTKTTPQSIFDADTFDDDVTLTNTPPPGMNKVTFGSEDPSYYITPLEDDNINFNNGNNKFNRMFDINDIASLIEASRQPQGIMGVDVGQDNIAFENDLMAKLSSAETREKTTLQMGKDLGINTPEQNEKLEQLKQKEKEAALNTTAIV
jgi:hypothetical protein